MPEIARYWHVASLVISVISTTFIQYAVGDAPVWAMRAASGLALAAALITNLERALFPPAKMFPDLQNLSKDK